jgi:hypothetical protein
MVVHANDTIPDAKQGLFFKLDVSSKQSHIKKFKPIR